MKKRRFADGGGTVEMGPNPNIDDDTRERARKFVEDNDSTINASGEAFKKALAKPKVVTKEELAKSGLSLRDYMNKQQGLTPRGGSATATPSANAYGKEQQYQRAQEAETSPEAKERRRAKEKEQALEASRPELDIAGGVAGGGLKTIAKLAKGLANRGGAKTAAKQLERVEPTLAKEAEQLALPAPVKRAGLDKAGAKAAERGARAESRNAEMLKENLKRYGMTERTSPDAIRGVRDNLGMGQNWKVMKKGGAVKTYAAGGAVSSRADGIAQRGKTRCKVC